jgi:hypothetical protein
MTCPHCNHEMEFHAADRVKRKDRDNPDHRNQWFCPNCWLHLDAKRGDKKPITSQTRHAGMERER